jgi:hypothetical protein
LAKRNPDVLGRKPLTRSLSIGRDARRSKRDMSSCGLPGEYVTASPIP